MQQLEINAKEMDTVNEELGIIETNENENYESFTTNLNNKRRTQSEQLASNVLKNAKTIDEAKKEALEREEIEKAKQAAVQSDGKKLINNIISKITPNIEVTITTKPQPKVGANESVTSKTSNQKKPNVLESILPDTVDEFNKFLEDSKVNENLTKIQIQNTSSNSIDSDDDINNKNPMVLNYCENIDLSDDEPVNQNNIKTVKQTDVNSSDDEIKTNVSNQYVKQNNKSPNLSGNNMSQNSNKIEVIFLLFLKLEWLNCKSIESKAK